MLGDNIRKYRKLLRMTQSDLADKLEVNEATIRNWEHDVGTSPFLTVVKICNSLRIDPNTLLDYNQSPNTTEDLLEEDQILINHLYQILRNKNLTIEELSSKLNK